MPDRRRKSNGSLSAVPNTRFRRAFAWTKLIISFALPLTVGIFTLVTTIQNRLIAQQHRDQDSQQAHEQREEGSKRAMDEQQEHVYVTYINDIAQFLIENADNLTGNKLTYVRTKTLATLRKLDSERKKQVFLFLGESHLLSNRFLLHGADFSGIRYDCKQEPIKDFSDFNAAHVSFRDASFLDCIFKKAMFDSTDLRDTKFIRIIFMDSHFTKCKTERVIMQSVMFRNNVWLDLTFAHIDFVLSAFLDTKATRVNLTGSLMIDRHFAEMNYIKDSILPNGTFYQMDETNLLVLNDNCTNSALISDFDYVEPHVNSTTRSCFFRSRVENAVLYFGIETMSHSFLIQSGQAEYVLTVRVLFTKKGINATVAFIMGSLTERYRAGRRRFQYRCIPEFDFLVCFMDTPCRIHGMIPSNLAMLTVQVLFLDAQAEVDNIDFRIRQSTRILQ